MMAVYHLGHATGYEYVTTVNGYDDDRAIDSLNGTSRKETWKPILVHRGPVPRQKGKPADLPAMHCSLLLRRSAVDALQDILDAHGELLPMATEDGIELYLFNTFFMLDALDKERSEIKRIPGTTIDIVRKYVFLEEKIRGIDIFRITFGPPKNLYSERFMQRVKKAKLKGVDFVKLWSSES